MRICKQFRFEAAHRLHQSKLSTANNAATFGKCGVLHGHSYLLEVFVEGASDETTGMVVNFSSISKIVKPFIENQLDHQTIIIASNIPATAENILLHLIGPHIFVTIKKCVLLRLWETSTAYAELTRKEFEHGIRN